MNEISCGVIVIDENEKFLIVHPTNAKWSKSWSLPKGICDKNESTAEAAVRELYEETSIKCCATNLIYLGTFKYKASKDLTLFAYHFNFHININNLVCTSTFIDIMGKNVHEVDKFALISKNQIYAYINPAQAKILDSIKNMF